MGIWKALVSEQMSKPYLERLSRILLKFYLKSKRDPLGNLIFFKLTSGLMCY